MSATAPDFVHTIRVGHRTCTITLPTLAMGKVSCGTVEWEPDMPTRLSQSELRQYRAGRNEVFAEMRRRFNGTAVTVEI